MRSLVYKFWSVQRGMFLFSLFGLNMWYTNSLLCDSVIVSLVSYVCLCIRVCVCVWEVKRERERGTGKVSIWLNYWLLCSILFLSGHQAVIVMRRRGWSRNGSFLLTRKMRWLGDRTTWNSCKLICSTKTGRFTRCCNTVWLDCSVFILIYVILYFLFHFLVASSLNKHIDFTCKCELQNRNLLCFVLHFLCELCTTLCYGLRKW